MVSSYLCELEMVSLPGMIALIALMIHEGVVSKDGRRTVGIARLTVIQAEKWLVIT